MTDKLATILGRALAELDDSNIWFDIYTESKLESDWQMSKEHHMRCRGLLEAYEILTGKKIHPLQHEILKELTYI